MLRDPFRMTPEETVLLEVATIREKHLLDEIGVIEQKRWSATEAKGNAISIVVRAARKKTQGIATEFEQTAEKRDAARAQANFGAVTWHKLAMVRSSYDATQYISERRGRRHSVLLKACMLNGGRP